MSYLNDNEGKPSSMRLMSMLLLVVASGLAVLTAFGIAAGPPEHILYFLLGAFAPKAVQKFAERPKS